ncbi:SUKH-4 family immunity protein [Streptomyces sp. TLI_171]|uniref:SUKH-4 family immunity protein n=1 Tax=Streptomyces sp. TLI_171 TaxID=1938859 RepID=UPI000C434D16|nr:SUKH-4 family immunity protein [Streptomyces sp. TLI_171]RKE23293.1 nucleic acid/nucleotide deaminase of polymorphic system toxin [Streptomyces sp. TLI_171]
MTTREQAIEAAHRWINGARPEEQWHRIGVHEFDLGWVLWPAPAAEEQDRPVGERRAPADIGTACAVVDRETGELTHWPSVPVDEVVQLYRDKLGAGSHDPSRPPATGPGGSAVLTYRDADGEQQSLFQLSTPGLGHPELRAWRTLQQQGVRPEDVLSVYTDLRPCELPGGYCASVLLAELPVATFDYGHDYGPRYDRRAAAVRALTDTTEATFRRSGRPLPTRPNRVPFPRAVPAAPTVTDQALAQQLAEQFGPDGVRRPVGDLPAGVPATLAAAGLPVEVPEFFHALPELSELPDAAGHLAATGRGARVPERTRALLAYYRVLGTDGRALIAVQCGDGGTGTGAGIGRIWAVDPDTGSGRYLNSDLASYLRCLALLASRHPALRGLTPEAAGAAVDAFQRELAAVDGTVFTDPENWWAVIVEQLWDGLL